LVRVAAVWHSARLRHGLRVSHIRRIQEFADEIGRSTLAARYVKTLAKAPDNDALLQLYALYKQASVGDVSGDRPSLMDPVGRAKYDAWTACRSMAAADAMAAYGALVEKLKAREA